MFFADLPSVKQVYFQNPATPIMEGIIGLHNTIFFFGVIILVFIIFMLMAIYFEFIVKGILFTRGVNYIGILKGIFLRYEPLIDFCNRIDLRKYFPDFYILNLKVWKKWTHQSELEVIWTLIPTFILLIIAIPSFILLYSLDAGASDPFCITIKVTGHQWYWTYEFASEDISKFDYGLYFDLEKLIYSFDSYMVTNEEFIKNPVFPRLLEAKPALWIPVTRYVRFLVTSTDVIHSWAIPSLGVKIDAIPGRLNQVFVFCKRPGIFYGQCSEICGVNHGFMPIKLIATDLLKYIKEVK
jgi:heme/copper-type cytochrome/quinol oxidase subunit 2